MTDALTRLPPPVKRFLIRSRAARFVIDFWSDPVRAVRRAAIRRTWPTPEEFAAMGTEEFTAYLERIGALR